MRCLVFSAYYFILFTKRVSRDKQLIKFSMCQMLFQTRICSKDYFYMQTVAIPCFAGYLFIKYERYVRFYSVFD
jgi:hypothetical protein